MKTFLLFLFSAVIILASSAISRAETLAHYKFEADALTADASENGNDLENSGITPSEDGAVFSGAEDAGLDSNKNLVGGAGSSFTAEGVITAAAPEKRRPVVAEYNFEKNKNNGWELFLNDSNELVLEIAETTKRGEFYVSPFKLEPGRKYYFAVAVDGTRVVNNNPQSEPVNVTFYFREIGGDGDLQSETVTKDQKNFQDPPATFTVGSRQDFKGNSFEGVIHEIRLSDGILTEEELLSAAKK